MSKIILFNKPYGVISQFRDHEKHPTLAEYITDKSLRIAGRLDTDSEGLMLLTDDGKLNAAITHPDNQKYKTYHAQVEGEPTDEQVAQLSKGVQLKDGRTLPAKVKVIEEPNLWERNPPVRFRKTVPTCWLEISICEGKNRQVRRMTAAVRLPTLRLVRVAIDGFQLDNLQPSEYKTVTLSADELDKLFTIEQRKQLSHNKPKVTSPRTKKTFGKPIRTKGNLNKRK